MTRARRRADDTIDATIVIGADRSQFRCRGARHGRGDLDQPDHETGHRGRQGRCVSSATANGAGGFDYVIGSLGMPPFLVDAATGSGHLAQRDRRGLRFGRRPWPLLGCAEPHRHRADRRGPGIATGDASVGTTAHDDGIQLLSTPTTALAEPPAPVMPRGAWRRNDRRRPDFENILLSLSTNAAGDITAATPDLGAAAGCRLFPVGPDSWVAGVINFSGVRGTAAWRSRRPMTTTPSVMIPAATSCPSA